MSRQRNRRSPVNANPVRRFRPMQAAGPLAQSRGAPASTAADEAAFTLLFDILVGDSAWTTAEVGHLISMRESADLGRWRVAGLDEEELGAR